MGSSKFRLVWVLCLGCCLSTPSVPAENGGGGVLATRNYRVRIGIARHVTRVAIQPRGSYRVLDSSGKRQTDLDSGSIYFIDIIRGTRGGEVYRLILAEFASQQAEEAVALASTAQRNYSIESKAIRYSGSQPGQREKILVTLGRFDSMDEALDFKRRVSVITTDFLYEERLPAHDGKVLIRDVAGATLASGERTLRLSPRDIENGSLSLQRAEDWKVVRRRQLEKGFHYRGNMDLSIDEEGLLTVVNDLWLEHYIYGVVAAEIGNFAPTEALKAQAVVARSEATAKIERGIVSSSELFDFNDTALAQRYKGKGQENDRVRAAVDATRGEVLVWEGKPIDAVYSHSCGGVVASANDLWDGVPQGYSRTMADRLGDRSVGDLSEWRAAHRWTSHAEDTFCNPDQPKFPNYAKGNYRWVKNYSNAYLTQLFDKSYGTGRVKDVTVTRRAQSGRVRGLRVVGDKKTVRITRELELREALGGLKSTFFTFATEYDDSKRLQRLYIHGAGFGHGVGLCQMGAYMMAVQKFAYRQILGHYFTEVKIRTMYGKSAPAKNGRT